MIDRQRPQENGIDDTKNGGIGADAQCERYDSDSRERRSLAEAPYGQPEIEQHTVHGLARSMQRAKSNICNERRREGECVRIWNEAFRMRTLGRISVLATPSSPPTLRTVIDLHAAATRIARNRQSRFGLRGGPNRFPCASADRGCATGIAD